MITLEDRFMINHLHKEGVPKTRIARELGVNRRTVDRAINGDKTDGSKRESQPRGSILDPYKDYIRRRLDKYDLTATRIQREITEHGYPGSHTILCSGYRFARTATICAATEESQTQASIRPI